MKNRSNQPVGDANADKGRTQGQNPNAERSSGTRPADNRSTAREGADASRDEKGNRQEPANPSGQSNLRVDDRPEQPQRRDDRSGPQAPGAPLPNRRTPNYGDAEPNDPRKLDVDAGTGGRTGSSDRTNRS